MCLRTQARAPTGDPCQPYYGKGYCTDYVARRLGQHPHGNPRTWPTNSNLSAIRPNVAVVFAGVTAAGHAAVVDNVIRDPQGRPVALEISEMNYSNRLRPDAPRQCIVTMMFGQVGRRKISIAGSGITGFWPP